MDGQKDGAKINHSVRTDIKNSILCWLATVDVEGMPSVTPKEIFSSYGDDLVVIADIASSNTVRNIRHHSAVCVSFVDPFRQRGFKITGIARIVGEGEVDFLTLGGELFHMAGGVFPIRHIISIQIRDIRRIWAPSYRFIPHQTETERMQAAYNTYGVVSAK